MPQGSGGNGGSRSPGFSSSGETAVSHSRTHEVLSCIVTKNLVGSTAAGMGVIAPPVQHFSTRTTSRTVIPDRHAKAALQSCGDGMGGMCGGEPSTSTKPRNEDGERGRG